MSQLTTPYNPHSSRWHPDASQPHHPHSSCILEWNVFEAGEQCAWLWAATVPLLCGSLRVPAGPCRSLWAPLAPCGCSEQRAASWQRVYRPSTPAVMTGLPPSVRGAAPPTWPPGSRPANMADHTIVFYSCCWCCSPGGLGLVSL